MKQRNKILLLLGIALIAIIVIVYIIILSTRNFRGDENINNEGDIFPFGEISTATDNEREEIVITDQENEVVIETQKDSRPRVFRITDRPVTASQLYDEAVTYIVTKEDKEGTLSQETIPGFETHVFFTDTRDGSIYKINLDTEEMDEITLTEPTVEKAVEGFVGGENGEYVVLRFTNSSTGIADTFVGERELEELPDQVCSLSLTQDLQTKSKGDEVLQLQKIVGFLQNDITAFDGVFGRETETSLKTYQKNNNIEVTGIADAITRDYLAEECLSIERRLQTARNEPRPVSGIFLRTGIRSLVMSPDKSRIFYIVKLETGSVGFVMDFKTQKEIQIFTSPFSDWIATWGGENTVLLHTAATGLVEGVSYALDVQTGEFKREYGETKGLTTLQSPNGKYIVAGEGNTTGIKTKIYNTEDYTTVTLDLNTIPEKCNWSKDSALLYCAIPNTVPKNTYPDSWYKGIEFFNDDFYALNPTNGFAEKIVDAHEFGEEIDAIDLHVSDQGKYLILRNRRDNALWGINLE